MAEKPNISRLWQLLQPPTGPPVVDQNGKVLPPSSPVFKELSAALTDEYPTMTPKNIYTILLSRRYNLYGQLIEALAIDNVDKSVNSETLSSSANDSLAGVITFIIDVTDVWPKIQPVSVTYQFQDGRRRESYALRRYSWTSILYEKIHAETRMPCAISFQNAKISGSGMFATISGKCGECKCEFTGHIANKPQPHEKIAMICEIRGFDPVVKHVKKRQLKGEARIAIAKQLVEGKLASQWQRAEADRLMVQLGEKEPPHLYSGKVLRKAKQEQHDKLLDIKSNNVFESLHLMMYSEKYDGAIRRIGLDPLMVMYWTKDQEVVYDHYHDTVYVDGTGSIAKKLELPNGDLCPHIYLYQIVTQVGEKTAPVGQMLSSAHSTDDLLMWLRLFLKTVNAKRSVVRVPKECVCDFDKALLGAVAQAFAQVVSLKHYMIVCFELLTAKTDAKRLPPCFIRLDVCHFSNMVARWKCFQDKHRQIRSFYLRSMAILRKQQTFQRFAEIARAIVTLALDHKGQPDGYAEQSRNFLAAEIRAVPSKKEIENDESETESEDVDEPEDEKSQQVIDKNYMANSNLHKWVDTLYKDVHDRIEAEDSTIAINGYHCPKFAQKFKVLLVYFPLFSEVMREIFGYGSVNATSAAVETEFNDLKNRTLKHVSKSLRVDKFVATHILSFPGKLKLAMADTEIEEPYDSTDDQSKRRHRPDTAEYSYQAQETSTPIRSIKQNAAKIESPRAHFSDDTRIEKGTCEGQTLMLSAENKSLPIVQNDSSECCDVKESISVSQLMISEHIEQNEETLIDIEELRAEHNWRNKNDKPKKRFRYADPCPWFNATTTFNVELPVIPNGNVCSVVRDKGQSISVRNTCGFDSLCQILAFAAAQNTAYKEKIVASTSPIFSCVHELLGTGLSPKFFTMRANILNIPQLKPNNHRNSIIKIVATSNIGDMAGWMLEDDPSYVTTKSCPTCKKESVKRSLIMSVDFDKWIKNGARGISDALNWGDSRTRPCCGMLPICNLQYGPHLLIETDIGGDKREALMDFPDHLAIPGHDTYSLIGVVVYEGSYNQNSVGHYTAYIKTASTWVLFDDAKPKAKPPYVDREVKVQAHLCIYVRS